MKLKISIAPSLLEASQKRVALGVVVGSTSKFSKSGDIEKLLHSSLKPYVGTSKDDIRKIPQVEALRDAYKNLKKNPNDFLGSNEALIARASKGEQLRSVNPVVDINNIICFESKRSCGSYDLEKVVQEMVFRVGKPGETYTKIGGRTMNLENLPVFADADGPFGSPTSDSQRAMIVDSTKNFITIVISFDGSEGLQQQTQRAQQLFAQVNATCVHSFVINADSSEKTFDLPGTAENNVISKEEVKIKELASFSVQPEASTSNVIINFSAGFELKGEMHLDAASLNAVESIFNVLLDGEWIDNEKVAIDAVSEGVKTYHGVVLSPKDKHEVKVTKQNMIKSSHLTSILMHENTFALRLDTVDPVFLDHLAQFLKTHVALKQL